MELSTLNANDEMTAARKSATATPEGSGSVMEAMKQFYHTVELEDLSKKAIAEVTSLSTTDGDSELFMVNLMYNVCQIGYYANHNIAAILGVLNDYAPMAEALRKTVVEKFGQADYGKLTDDEDKEDAVQEVLQKYWDLTYDLCINSFTLEKDSAGADYIVKFTPGSDPHKFLPMERSFGRQYGEFNRIERNLTLSPGVYHNVQDANDHAQYTIDRIKSAFGIDINTASTRQLVEVPLDYDFSILFKDSQADNGAFNIIKPRVDDTLVSKHKLRWSILVSVLNKSDTALTNPVAQLAATEFVTYPIVRISAEAAKYLTQAKSEKDIKLSTLHSWVTYWVRDCFNCEDTEVKTVNSLLDNFHFSKKKEQLGIKTQNTRADPNSGLFVNFEGRLCHAPDTDAVDESSILAYEAVYDKFIEECAKAKEPVSLDVDFNYSHLINKPLFASVLDVKDQLMSFNTVPLISNWDLNISASINVNDPTELDQVKLSGGTKPTAVAMGELLSDNITGGMRNLLSGICEDEDDIRFNSAAAVKGLPVRNSLAAIYAFLKCNGKLSVGGASIDIETALLAASNSVTKGKGLQEGDFEYGIYSKFDIINGKFISKDCTHFGSKVATDPDDQARLEDMIGRPMSFGVTVNDLHGKDVDFVKDYNLFCVFYDLWATLFDISSSPTLRRYEQARYTGDADSFSVDQSPYWLDTYNQNGSVKDLATLARSYVVGNAFARICNALMGILRTQKNPVMSFDANTKKPVFRNKPVLPNYKYICEGVMPFLSVFGYMLNRVSTIIDAAKEESEKFKPKDDTVLPTIPGGKDVFAVFKHQDKALRLLRNEPRVSFLDISAGGGKTVIGLTDCLMLMGQGKVKRPLFIAPQNLIKNWIIDLNKQVTDFKYNCIPITAKTVEKWGEKKLTQMIQNSPPNTVFLTDMSFVGVWTRKITLQFMNLEHTIYANLEWMKQFEFDYILIDEVHYLKNAKGSDGGSTRSRLIAELTLNPEVKYIRLASGTIISNDVDDIIGQTRLVDPSIFRTYKDFTNMYLDDEGGGWTPDAAERIRMRLAKYCGVAHAKRKDWIYALPTAKEEHPSEWIVTMDEEFKTVYEHVCRQTITEMEGDEDLMKRLKKRKKGETEDDAVDRMLDEDGDSDDDGDLSGKLQVYIDRLEQFVNAPEADPLNGWNGLDFSKLNTPKIPKIVELLDKHFSDPKAGKVIIFVRHIQSVYGIINRLPEKYRKMTVDYHSAVKSNLVKFNKDDDVKIVVGVEMSMNTGENLQIANRVIRCELCWAPGEIEQAFARVFRPDFYNKYNRQFVYSDWIICDDSLEIPKMGRLISKMLRKVQFDEYSSANPEYRKLPYVPPLGLNMKKFLDPTKAIRRADQIPEYWDAYYRLASIQYNEFAAERAKYIDANGNVVVNPYVEVDGGDEIDDAKLLTFTPLVPDQNFVNDVDGDGLTAFREWIAKNKKYEDDPDLMVAKGTTIFVYTEFGYGYIYAAPRKTKNGFNRVQVMMSYGEKLMVPTDSVYVAENRQVMSLKDELVKKYIGVNSSKVEAKYRGIDPRESNQLIYRDEDGGYKKYVKGGSPTVKVKTVQVKPAATPTTPTATPAPAMVPQAGPAQVPINTYVPQDTGEDNKLSASLCLIDDSIFVAFSVSDPDSTPLAAAKYTKVSPYIGIMVKNLDEYDKAIAYVGKQFKIFDPNDRFGALRKRFNNKTKLFKGQFSNDDIKFLLLDHKRVKNDANIKLNYLVEDGQLFLVFNATANPAAAAALKGKKPAGVKDKFRKFESMFVREFHSKQQVLLNLQRINTKVAEIINYNEIVEQLDELTKA